MKALKALLSLVVMLVVLETPAIVQADEPTAAQRPPTVVNQYYVVEPGFPAGPTVELDVPFVYFRFSLWGDGSGGHRHYHGLPSYAYGGIGGQIDIGAGFTGGGGYGGGYLGSPTYRSSGNPYWAPPLPAGTFGQRYDPATGRVYHGWE